MEHDETKRLKQILTSLGKLVSDLGKKKKGELVMSSFELLQMKLPDNCDLKRYNSSKYKTDHESSFCNHTATYPAYLPNIFSSFWVGALRLADPDLQFFFFFRFPI